MKTKLVAIILSAVLLLGGAAVGLTVYNNTPEVVARNAILGMFQDLIKRDEINPLYNMITQGSLEASVSEFTEDGEDLLEDTSIAGKLYFSKEAFMLENADVKLFGGDFHASGDIYLSNELIYIKEDHILGGAYGITPKELSADLRSSIFAPDSGSEYAIPDEEVFDAITETSDSADLDAMKKDAEKLLKKYIKQAWKIICDDAEFDSETTDVRLNGEKKTVRVVTIDVDADAMASMLRDAYDFLKNDGDVVKFIETYQSSFSSFAGELYNTEEYGSMAEAFEALIDDIGDDLDELCEELHDSGEERITIEIATPKLTADLLKLTVKVDDDVFATLDFGEKGLKKTDKISVEVEETKIAYEITQNDKKQFDAALKIDGEKPASISINKADHSYKLKCDTYTVSGSIETKRKSTTITVDKITDSWYSSYENKQKESTYETDIKIVINEKDKIPAAPKTYRKISEISDHDVEAWLNKFDF